MKIKRQTHLPNQGLNGTNLHSIGLIFQESVTGGVWNLVKYITFNDLIHTLMAIFRKCRTNYKFSLPWTHKETFSWVSNFSLGLTIHFNQTSQFELVSPKRTDNIIDGDVYALKQ